MSAELDAFRELLTRQLSHVASAGNRHLRGLSKADYDDVLSDALADAWEKRESFSPAEQSFAQWFAAKVKVARQRYRRQTHQGYNLAGAINDIFASDDTEQNAAIEQEFERLDAIMTPEDREIAAQVMAGNSLRKVAVGLGVTRDRVKAVSKRLRRVERMGGDARLYATTTTRTPDSDNDQREPANIDRDIAEFLRRPAPERGVPRYMQDPMNEPRALTLEELHELISLVLEITVSAASRGLTVQRRFVVTDFDFSDPDVLIPAAVAADFEEIGL